MPPESSGSAIRLDDTVSLASTITRHSGEHSPRPGRLYPSASYKWSRRARIPPSTSTTSGVDHLGITSTATTSAALSRGRRESFLYRTEPCEAFGTVGSSGRPISRASSIASADPQHADDVTIVTPFAQLLASLWNVRSNLIAIANLSPEDKTRAASGGKRVTFTLNTQPLSDDAFQCAKETLEELDWCLEQLEAIKTHRSVTEMASNKFRRLLNRELNHFAGSSKAGPQISKFLLSTYVHRSEEEAEASGSGDLVESLLISDSKCDENPSSPASSHPSLFSKAKTAMSKIGDGKRLRGLVSINSIPPDYGVQCQKEIEVYMSRINDWGINIFKIHEFSKSHSLVTVTYSLLQQRGLIKQFNIPQGVLVNYLLHLEHNYRSNPYHNSTHAADVVQSMNVLISSPALKSVFSDLEILAAIFSSAIHDVDHPGFTNQYLINTNNELAILYNDESVLEQHHLAVAFKLLQYTNCDWIGGLSKKQRQSFRKTCIAMVLATDMSKHMSLLADLKTMVESKKVSGSSEKLLENHTDRIQVLQTMIHLADLSNPTKPIDIYRNWNERILEEYWRQGDKERHYGLEISPMCDRGTVTIEKSQIGFIDYIVHPLFETWAELVYPDASSILDQLEENRHWYVSRLDPEEVDEAEELVSRGHPSRASGEESLPRRSDGSIPLCDFPTVSPIFDEPEPSLQ